MGILDSFGEQVKQLRQEMGMSQTEFARLLGQPQCTISQIETGRHIPPMKHLDKLLAPVGYRVVIGVEKIEQ